MTFLGDRIQFLSRPFAWQQLPEEQHEQEHPQQQPPPPQQVAQAAEHTPVPLQHPQQACFSVNKPAFAKEGVAAQQQHLQSSSNGLELVVLQQQLPEQQQQPPPPQQAAQDAEHTPVPLQHPQQACFSVNKPAFAKEGVAAQQQHLQSSSNELGLGAQQQLPEQQEEQQQLQHPALPQQDAHFGLQMPVPLQHPQHDCSSVSNPALAIPGEAAQQQQAQSSASKSLFTTQS
jgi:hypothetical protein